MFTFKHTQPFSGPEGRCDSYISHYCDKIVKSGSNAKVPFPNWLLIDQ